MLKSIYFTAVTLVLLLINLHYAECTEQKTKYQFDSNQVRYELYQSNEGVYNWLFFPGGPGADSCYLRSLIDLLKLPGNVWLIDLPGNGTNTLNQDVDNYDFWFELFPKVVKQFDNPIVVGHSFGGMLPMLYPELENILKGCVIMNSTPQLWMEEAAAYSKQFDLPDHTQDMLEFITNPSQEAFEKALEACMPYYFPKETVEMGKELVSQVTFQYKPAVWAQIAALEGKLLAKWAPQHIPTLIIGGKYDCICPFTLFLKDDRFHRDNIQLLFIEDAGHFPWIENPTSIRRVFEEFVLKLTL